jgi:hypothetical protein
MAIPEHVLDNWTNYQTAAISSAQETHDRIRGALEGSSVLAGHEFETFLQGSYANTTLVRGSGDVDIVVQLNETWLSDLSQLDSVEKERYRNNTSSASYSWANCRSDVLDMLTSRYGAGAIIKGDKAIEVDTDSLPIGADVVVCQQYRLYRSLPAYPGEFEQGIVFWPRSSNEKIINFPKQHIENGADNQSRTNDRYKETARMIKNARNTTDERGLLSKDRAPSYFIECLLYNVPASEYSYGLQDRFVSIVEYLMEDSIGDYQCQNELLPLFGSDSTQWSTRNANSFITNLSRLYNNW